MLSSRTSSNACVCYIRRSLSTGKGGNGCCAMAAAAAARPWCREASTVIARRPWKEHSQLKLTPGNMHMRRCIRSVGSTPPLSTLSRTSSTFSKGDANVNGTDPSAASWKIAAVFAAIASGACLDRLGTTIENNGGTDDDDDRILFWGGLIKGPLVARMMKRRDTSIQIRFGDSVLLNHVEPLSSTTVAGANGDEDIVLLLPEDKETISPFLYYLMTQVELVRVQKDDNYQYNLPIGLPGLGCAHCRSSSSRQKTTRTRCQIFPLDRRTFPAKVRKGLYNHIRRCDRCPVEVKLELRRLKNLEVGTKISREERQFFKKLWFRMGHKEVI
jgi:hypothetical protein